ncbi:MAG: FAD-dependent oxidoreductase [Deltaproteobacteria bacterium]|nr:FAD-dependent oxidoreductase [Deltaproteobacteria bacterium]
MGPLRRSAFPEAGPPETVDVLIVGAGVSGLAAAFRLKPRKCTVLERASQIGGTGAAAVSLSGQQFALAAHYECNLSLDFGKEVLDIYRDLGIVEPRPGTNSLGFVDRHHHVDPARSEQAILTDGTLRTRGWRMFASDPVATRFKDRLLQQAGDFCLPTRLSPERAKDAQRRTFRAWLTAEGFESGTELERSMNILLKSDYGADAALVNAYAGLHYFLCRPYFTTGTETFSPPQGLQYFADKLLAATPGLDLRLETLVVRLVPHADHVEVVALDVGAKRTRRFRARAVVFAAPKKVLKYVYPPDRALFAANRYAAWITVTFELKETFPETELLAWANHVPERSGVHVGFSWANHHTPDQPPIITHYLALPPGKLSHFEVLLARPGPVVKRCLELMAVLFGRDLGAITRRVTLQKLGHSMPTPVVGSLFTDPNRHRACPRIAYAGVDTGRLPVLAEAFDSALDAVAAIREV